MSSTFFSKTSLVLSPLEQNKQKKSFQPLKKEMIDPNVPRSIVPFIYSFYKSTSFFSSIFIFEIRQSTWCEFDDSDRWDLNENSYTRPVLCNWQGRCFPKLNFTLMKSLRAPELALVEVPLLQCEEHIQLGKEPVLTILSVFIPLCLLRNPLDSI